MALLGHSVRALSGILRFASLRAQLLCDMIRKTGLNDEEALLLASARIAIDYNITAYNQAVVHLARQPGGILQNDAAKSKLYRLLMRTAYAMDAAMSLHCSPKLIEASRNSSRRSMHAECFADVRARLVAFLRQTRLLQPPLGYSPSCLQPWRANKRLICKDHLHDENGLIWPNSDVSTEMRILVGTSRNHPVVTFRDFSYKPMPLQSAASNAFHSAVDAMQRTIAMSAQWPAPATIIAGSAECTTAESTACRDRQRLSDLLACVGYHAWMHYKRSVRDFRLGIITPGCSQVFWPGGDSASPTARQTVYIQAEHVFVHRRLTYRFRGVETVRYKNTANRERTCQTVRFLDLPAEVRNQIYENVVEELPAHRFPTKQPAMSLTCHQINEEIVLLFVKRCGWLVCG
ncbi:hypothetical protein LTR17_024776 [Elasticomyces elasticus]|nr:hypothetical protein LTR17_024776 [Elasticomyces elasticus]